MTCKQRFFVGRKTDIQLNDVQGLIIGFIDDITVTFTHRDDPSQTAAMSLLTDSIFVQDATSLVATLSETALTLPGLYDVRVDLIDIEGALRRATPCPSTLFFYA